MRIVMDAHFENLEIGDAFQRQCDASVCIKISQIEAFALGGPAKLERIEISLETVVLRVGRIAVWADGVIRKY